MSFRKSDAGPNLGFPRHRRTFNFGATFQGSQNPSGKWFRWAYAVPAQSPSDKQQRNSNGSASIFEGRRLADVNNRAMKDFVDSIGALAPSTIRDYSNIVKAIVASAINEDGEELFPRKWNEEYIDAPLVDNQRPPTILREQIQKLLEKANGQFRMLYTLLAGCGPMRVGEALGLDVSQISEDRRTLTICQKAKRGELQPYLKTKNGERQIDLCPELAELLSQFIGSRTAGLLFSTATGNQLLQSNTLQDSLHTILRKINLVKGGFNIFRRFRITHLEKGD